jgi:hypothetical protein
VLKTISEIRRHIVFKLTGRSGVSLFGPSTADRSHLAEATVEGRFNAIYDRGIWKGGREEIPGSGPGSDLAATETIRREIPPLLDKMGSEILLDVGCGDFTWMKEVAIRQSYIGTDIVRSVTDLNQQVFASDRRRFECRDAITDSLPAADTILCREMLFHLSLEDAGRALRNMLAVPRRWLIATTETQTQFNADIHTGDYRPLNLQRPPFRFPAPDYAIDDSAVAAGRLLAAWRVERLPRSG